MSRGGAKAGGCGLGGVGREVEGCEGAGRGACRRYRKSDMPGRLCASC